MFLPLPATGFVIRFSRHTAVTIPVLFPNSRHRSAAQGQWKKFFLKKKYFTGVFKNFMAYQRNLPLSSVIDPSTAETSADPFNDSEKSAALAPDDTACVSIVSPENPSVKFQKRGRKRVQQPRRDPVHLLWGPVEINRTITVCRNRTETPWPNTSQV